MIRLRGNASVLPLLLSFFLEYSHVNGGGFMSCRELDLQKDYIINSHERCRQYKVEQDRIYSKTIISGNELYKKLEAKRELIDTAESYMNRLYYK